MSAVIATSAAMLLVATVWSVVLLVRTGEPRIGALTALFCVLLAREISSLLPGWEAGFVFAVPDAREFAELGLSVLSLLSLIALQRTLAERDLAEALHWDSMETVRSLVEAGDRPNVDLDEKVRTLLDLGRARFELDVGVISRVRGEASEVLSIRAPEDFPVARGAVFALDETPWSSTVAARRPIAFERAAAANPAGREPAAALRFVAYLGAPVRVDGEVFGTLSFASRHPRKTPFTATDKDLVSLMAQWLGPELERAEGTRERHRPAEASEVRDAPPAPAPRAKPGAKARRRAPAAAGIDANAAVRRIEPGLRRALAPDVELALELETELRPVRAQGVPLAPVIRSLVLNGARAMPVGGRVTLRTANLESARGAADRLPAADRAGYVTLSVGGSGASPGATAGDDPVGEPDPEGGLSLPTIERRLRAAGGDLSVEVEAGRGSTVTVFLPCAEAAPAREASVKRRIASQPEAPGPPDLASVSVCGARA